MKENDILSRFKNYNTCKRKISIVNTIYFDRKIEGKMKFLISARNICKSICCNLRRQTLQFNAEKCKIEVNTIQCHNQLSPRTNWQQ